MKVCFISPKSYPIFDPSVEGVHGGAETQIYLLAKHFPGEAVVAVGDYGQPDMIEKQGILTYKLFLRANIISKILKALKVLRGIDADVYIQRGLSAFSPFVSMWCRFLGKKFVYMISNDKESDGTHRLYKKWYSIFFRNFLRKCSAVFVQNDHQERSLALKNIKSFRLNSAIEVVDKENKERKETILWVGRLDRFYKQPEIFLGFAKQNPDISCLMVASAATDQKEYFDQIKKKASLINNLGFISGVKRGDMKKFYQRALLLVNTSSSEGFPATFLESLSVGTPVFSLTVDPSGILNDYGVGESFDGSEEELFEGIKNIIFNKSLLNDMGVKSIEYVRVNHGVDAVSLDFQKKLKKVLENKHD